MSSFRLALLGDPVEHSRSPGIHSKLLELAGLDGSYVTVRAGPPELTAAVAALRRGAWDGLNVTMPLKTRASGLADTLSAEAELSKSVNTLEREGRTVRGHSTDSTTVGSLARDYRFRKIGAALILGAGGSAAAAIAGLPADWPVYLASRRPVQAEALAERMRGDVVSWGVGVAGALVINATPLGMRGERLPDGPVAAAAGLIDLPYREGMTPAIEQFNRQGKPLVDGWEFLVRQAIASFDLWTGVRLEFERVMSALTKA